MDIYRTMNPQERGEYHQVYKLRSGRAVRGTRERPYGAFYGLNISERRETILSMSAARQERLAALGVTPEKPVINVIGRKPCPERFIISIREVPECRYRTERSECSIGGTRAYCSHGLGPGTCAYCSESARDSSKGLGLVKRSRTLLSQFFAKLDFIPPRAYDIGGGRYGDRISFLALIVVCAVVIYCVKRNNSASADDADAAMVPADAIANPTLFKRLLNA